MPFRFLLQLLSLALLLQLGLADENAKSKPQCRELEGEWSDCADKLCALRVLLSSNVYGPKPFAMVEAYGCMSSPQVDDCQERQDAFSEKKPEYLCYCNASVLNGCSTNPDMENTLKAIALRKYKTKFTTTTTTTSTTTTTQATTTTTTNMNDLFLVAGVVVRFLVFIVVVWCIYRSIKKRLIKSHFSAAFIAIKSFNHEWITEARNEFIEAIAKDEENYGSAPKAERKNNIMGVSGGFVMKTRVDIGLGDNVEKMIHANYVTEDNKIIASMMPRGDCPSSYCLWVLMVNVVKPGAIVQLQQAYPPYLPIKGQGRAEGKISPKKHSAHGLCCGIKILWTVRKAGFEARYVRFKVYSNEEGGMRGSHYCWHYTQLDPFDRLACAEVVGLVYDKAVRKGKPVIATCVDGYNFSAPFANALEMLKMLNDKDVTLDKKNAIVKTALHIRKSRYRSMGSATETVVVTAKRHEQFDNTWRIFRHGHIPFSLLIASSIVQNRLGATKGEKADVFKEFIDECSRIYGPV